MDHRIITIVGPTAAGKTSVALEIAESLGGEIVSADSRQLYRHLDIGTAKPTATERARAAHHLIDMLEPDERYDASRYADDAEEAISALIERGVEPLVVGGTGLYVRSLFEGMFKGPGRDEEVRASLEGRVATEGAPALHAELSKVDPATAERIHENDSTRIVRALEVYGTTGLPLSEWQRGPSRQPRYRPAYYGLALDRQVLHERIAARVDEMLARGLVEEVRGLLASGRIKPGSAAADAVGYREIIEALMDGDDSDRLRAAAEDIKTNTRRYARRQLTWCRSLKDVVWLDVGELGVVATAEAIVADWRLLQVSE